MRDVRLAVERVRCVHEWVRAVDMDAHVPDPVARGTLDVNVGGDVLPIIDDDQTRFAFEQPDESGSDVVLLIGVRCACQASTASRWMATRARGKASRRSCGRSALEETAGVVVVEVSQNDQIHIFGLRSRVGQRSPSVRPEALERPPGARDARAAVDQHCLLRRPEHDDVDRGPVPASDRSDRPHEPG